MPSIWRMESSGRSDSRNNGLLNVPARISMPRTQINRRSLRAHAFEHPVNHHAGLAEIVRGVAQSRELGTAQVLCDLLVFREQIKQWTFLPDRFATDVVDQI